MQYKDGLRLNHIVVTIDGDEAAKAAGSFNLSRVLLDVAEGRMSVYDAKITLELGYQDDLGKTATEKIELSHGSCMIGGIIASYHHVE